MVTRITTNGDEANEARESSAIVVGADTDISRPPHSQHNRRVDMTKQDKPVAVNLDERREMDKQGAGGSVQNDIADFLDEGDFESAFDYFGDEDPIAFL